MDLRASSAAQSKRVQDADSAWRRNSSHDIPGTRHSPCELQPIRTRRRLNSQAIKSGISITPNTDTSVRSVHLEIGIHEIHEIQYMCEIYLPKCRNPVQLCEIHCLKVEIPHAHTLVHTTIY